MGDQLEIMRKAGFIEERYYGPTGVETSAYTEGALFSGIKG